MIDQDTIHKDSQSLEKYTGVKEDIEHLEPRDCQDFLVPRDWGFFCLVCDREYELVQ